MAKNPFKVGDWAQVKGAKNFKPRQVEGVSGLRIGFGMGMWAFYGEYEKVEPVVKATPFPEPERWAATGEKIGNATVGLFGAKTRLEADCIVCQHNAEIDMLMVEIRRLEALVNK
jgi:hypothetical protein